MNQLPVEFKAFVSCPHLFREGLSYISNFEVPEIFNQIELPLELPHYLGKRMEVYLQALIECSDEYILRHKGIQVRKGNLTLGELDLIVENSAGEWIHVETATKFYLYDPNRSGEFIDKWIGPNDRDALVFKMNKMLTHQLPLLNNEAIPEIIPGLPSVVQQQVLLKGQLFLPWGTKEFDFKELNDACRAGYWVGYKEFEHWDHSRMRYQLVTKSEWLLNPTDEALSSFEVIEDDLKSVLKSHVSPMVWVKDDHTGEVMRLFVVFWS